jgi:hypothetical protein
MILDTQNLFSDSQAITVTADSTNVIDLGVAGRDIGVDAEFDLLIEVPVAFTAAGAATMSIALVTDDDVAFGAAVTLFTTGVLGKAAFPAGTVFKYRLSPGVKRYLKLVYTVATGPMTAGKVTSGFVHGLQAWKAYSAPFQA